jgi:hypothetical protein
MHLAMTQVHLIHFYSALTYAYCLPILLPGWFFIVRRTYQLYRKMAAKKVTLRENLHSTLQVLYLSLQSDMKFRLILVMALVLTLAWWYLDRWAGLVVGNDPYEVLGLTPPVTLQEIKRAYRYRSMAYRGYYD